MKETLNLSLRLALICAVAAMALAKVDDFTRGPIAEAIERARREAVEAVLPPFAELVADTLGVDDETRTYDLGCGEDGVTGVAFASASGLGYSGEIKVMIGVDAAGVVTGVRILQHAETPGLGANYAAPDVLDAFYKGAGFADRDWRVRKDGGDLDAITGATVTGRALADAITKGLQQYSDDRDELFADGKAAVGEVN